MYAHERYHHKIESYGIRLTVVTRSPKYLNYWNNVQSRFISQPSQNNLEDALANAEIVRYLRESQNRRLLGQLVTAAAIDYFEHTFIPQSPAGYRDALKYLSRDAFKAGERDLQSRLDESSLTPTRANYEWMAAPRLTHGLFDRNDNIWTIVRPGIRSIFPTIPLTVSSRDLVSCLRSLGWTVRGGRGKGSHVRMTSFDGRSHATVPGNRRDLTPGVVKSVERAVGRPIREWCP
jgi:predicted RNA binding protein YcfA (HicA-like mRNA interferase family)